MGPSEWFEFHCELYDVVRDLAFTVDSIGPGVIRLRNGRSLSLLQLAQHCHLRAREDWHELISTHLCTMTAHLHDGPETFSMFDLRVRLVPDVPADGEILRSLGSRPFVEGVVQVLAIDVAGAVRCVPESEIVELGWNADEAWASARAQTEMFEVPDELHTIDIGGVDILHVFGERSFTASMVGVVDQLVAEVAHIGETGAIVSMPLRHSLLVHPIDDSSVRTAIAGMIPITRQLFKQGPGSVSPHLYWWRDGALEWIPTFFDGTMGGVEFYPSDELGALVAGLVD
ncbi:MAG: hypothetical protein AB8G14_12095 [Ilumatobacter sp.]